MKAILFPGQGSQFVGMGKNHFDKNESFRNTIELTDRILGYKLSKIMFEGPAEKLSQTKYTQPAIFVHSVALFSELSVSDVKMTAGHSLGELSALCASGALSFEDTLNIVSLRGELMQKAGEINPGTMAAIIGLKDAVVERLCKKSEEVTGKPVVPANYNSPGQLVISGDLESIDKAIELAKNEGCRLARKLPVSGAFHSPLMTESVEGLKEKLQQITFTKPKFPIYCNYNASPVTDVEQLKSNLIKQLTNPVRWTQTLKKMKEDGANHFVEIGPGRVLQGLVKRTLDNVEIEGLQ